MTTKDAQKFVSAKAAQLQREGYGRRQAVAIAFSEARERGYKVPPMSAGSHIRKAERTT